ncbi:hypothetical protein FQN49_004049 [Arthroderma sp. PD_2]|nr:hypothetical protein FQN49_004049 [Arthroderma sp. PD_2]
MTSSSPAAEIRIHGTACITEALLQGLLVRCGCDRLTQPDVGEANGRRWLFEGSTAITCKLLRTEYRPSKEEEESGRINTFQMTYVIVEDDYESRRPARIVEHDTRSEDARHFSPMELPCASLSPTRRERLPTLVSSATKRD